MTVSFAPCPFADVELEKYYAYLRHLLTKLPKDGRSAALHLDDEVALEYYRLQKIREGSIELQKDGDAALDPLTEAGARREKEVQARLSEIIDILNNRFATEFTDADKLFFDQIEQDFVEDEEFAQQAQNNSIDNLKYGFEDKLYDKLFERMDANRDIFARIMDDPEFRTIVADWMLQRVYNRLNNPPEVV